MNPTFEFSFNFYTLSPEKVKHFLFRAMQEKRALPSIYDFTLPTEISQLFSAQESLHQFSKPTSNDVYYQRNIRGWSDDEDNLLRQAVSQFKGREIKWEVVARNVPRRNMKQCRERWEFHLNPNINKEPFTPSEDRHIITQQRKLGNRWTIIAEQLPGRTSSSVKNRWYTVLKKLTPKEVNQILNYQAVIQSSTAKLHKK
ncbi:Myb-like DNA-binding domain containing protein [Tritrichomonas foetus]|uniref:Myb-like DNA-binding domain containing protein n=1 Tax=Tritrichomonas foetus TaxID=1144522 RepID=A0A1J4KJV3_9EUKA|nr:Myb-like DNA-binding domain containing protein [Tritrichomonas foetus]|eukprot:OHT11224.1 Myb-like DNA-binding domain containing protein [Tritrichomonas foetus]